MTITMSSKNQITIPRRLVKELQLSEGALFNINRKGNRLELIPVETIEKEFTDEEYAKMEAIYQKEKHLVRPIIQKDIDSL